MSSTDSWKIAERAAAVFIVTALSTFLTSCAASKPAPVSFPDGIRADELTGIRIAFDLTGSVDLTKQPGGWVVTPDGIPADTARLRVTLEQLLGLHKRDRIATSGAGPNLLEKYGLDPGNEKVFRLLFGHDRVVHLHVGQTYEEFGTTYWTQDGQDGIFRVTGNATHSVLTDALSWKSRTVFPDFVGDRDIQELRMSWTDSSGARQHYKLVRMNLDSLAVVEPLVRGIPRQKSVEILGRARQFIADGFPDSVEAAQMLSEAASDSTSGITVEILSQDGGRYRLRTVGENAEYYFAAHPAGGLVLIYKWRFHGLAIPVNILTDLIPFGPYPDDGFVDGPPPPGMGILKPHFHDVPDSTQLGPDEHEDHREH